MLFLLYLVFVLNSIELFFPKYCVIRKGNMMNNTSNLITLIRLIGRLPFTIPDNYALTHSTRSRTLLQVFTKVIAQEQTIGIFREDQSNSIEFSFNSLSKDINHINGNGFTQYYSKKMSST